MSEPIHVNTYKRKDGTVVKEHYRGGTSQIGLPDDNSGLFGGFDNSSEDNSQNTPKENEQLFEYKPKTQPLQGHIETSHLADNPTSDQEILRNLFDATSGLKIPDNINDNIGITTDNQNKFSFSQISSAIDDIVQKTKNELKLTGRISSSLKQAIHSQIQKAEQTLLASRNLEENLLDKLTNTKSKQEYKNLYNKYIIQKNLNEKNKDLLNQLQYSTSNNNYEDVVEKLNNYKSNYKELVERNSQERPLQPPEKNTLYRAIKKAVYNLYRVPSDIKDTWEKRALDIAIPIGNVTFLNKTNDAAKMWEISSHDFKNNENYVNKNGALIYSVNDIPDDNLKGLVSKKLNQQVSQNDTMGMIYNSKSNMSKQMSTSPEIKNYFQKNKDDLLNGKLVKDGGTIFTKENNLNLYGAIKRCDIPYSYIDKNGDLVNLVFDTYDFNPSESNILVKLGRSAQEKKVIRNYYSLTVVKTPKKIWEKWLK